MGTQVQLLACLRWLGEFQILPLIPLRGSILTSEIATLANVPKTQLERIVRMTATTGFLFEPQAGHVAHTTLSTGFVTSLNLLDSAMFLSETVVPASLHMATAVTEHDSKADSAVQSGYSIATGSLQSFQSACKDQDRLQRQWSAFRQCIADTRDSLSDVLGRMDWSCLGEVRVVDVSAVTQMCFG